MSKAVKSVGRAIGKVVKGVVNVVKGVGKAIGKFAKSKVGKVLLTAAAIYFGGAAISGAMAAPAGSGITGAISGAGSGISNAWAGLTQATGSAMAGNFAEAGSQLSTGFAGQAAEGVAQAAASGATPIVSTPVTTSAANGMTQSQMLAAQNAGIPGAAQATNTALSNGLLSTAGSGGSSSLGGFWNGLGDYGKMAAVQGGTQLVGGLISGYGQSKAAKDAQAAEEAKIAEQSKNRGTLIFRPYGVA